MVNQLPSKRSSTYLSGVADNREWILKQHPLLQSTTVNTINITNESNSHETHIFSIVTRCYFFWSCAMRNSRVDIPWIGTTRYSPLSWTRDYELRILLPGGHANSNKIILSFTCSIRMGFSIGKIVIMVSSIMMDSRAYHRRHHYRDGTNPQSR